MSTSDALARVPLCRSFRRECTASQTQADASSCIAMQISSIRLRCNTKRCVSRSTAPRVEASRDTFRAPFAGSCLAVCIRDVVATNSEPLLRLLRELLRHTAVRCRAVRLRSRSRCATMALSRKIQRRRLCRFSTGGEQHEQLLDASLAVSRQIDPAQSEPYVWPLC